MHLSALKWICVCAISWTLSHVPPHPRTSTTNQVIGNHYFACWCSVKGQPGMLPTGWEAGNTYWRRFIRRNGRFIFNIESQSECYYYWVYCCTPIAVLAVYLSRWRQNSTLPSKSFIDGRYISFHMWLWFGIELENSTTKVHVSSLRKFTQQTKWL